MDRYVSASAVLNWLSMDIVVFVIKGELQRRDGNPARRDVYQCDVAIIACAWLCLNLDQ